MPGGLPPVLITNIESITEEIDNDERVQVEDVVRLWRGMICPHSALTSCS